MNVRTFTRWATTICLAALLGGVAAAEPQPAPQPPVPQPPVAPQTPAPAPPPRSPRAATAVTPPAAPAAPRRQYQSVNVKIDLAITDQRPGSPAGKRTLSVVVADGASGSVRSQSEVRASNAAGVAFPGPNVELPSLNVDANPELLPDGKIRLHINLQYDWRAPVEQASDASRGTLFKTVLHDSMTLILEDGKSMVAAQSADPVGDRQATVEVKATVLR